MLREAGISEAKFRVSGACTSRQSGQRRAHIKGATPSLPVPMVSITLGDVRHPSWSISSKLSPRLIRSGMRDAACARILVPRPNVSSLAAVQDLVSPLYLFFILINRFISIDNLIVAWHCFP